MGMATVGSHERLTRIDLVRNNDNIDGETFRVRNGHPVGPERSAGNAKRDTCVGSHNEVDGKYTVYQILLPLLVTWKQPQDEQQDRRADKEVDKVNLQICDIFPKSL